MTYKEIILDSLIDGADYGECEMQIKESFEFLKIAISIEEFKKLISEMINEGLICANTTWTNEHNETPYVLTSKGKTILRK